jgi:hypothetical protein
MGSTARNAMRSAERKSTRRGLENRLNRRVLFLYLMRLRLRIFPAPLWDRYSFGYIKTLTR